MLYWATSLLQSYYSGFRVFHYLTFRAILAVLTSLLIALLAGPAIIRYLNRIKVGQIVRDDGPKDHLKKVGTPTMGGVLILIAVTISTCLWSDLNQYCVWIVLGVMLGFGCIGGLDDYYKLARQHSRGLSVKQKLGWQSLIALIVALFLYQHEPFAQQIYLVVPFVKETYLELGWLFLILTYFVVVGTSNAVNLTDGLDGLAIMPVVLVSGALAIFAYVAGNVAHAKYLGVPYIAGSGELVIFCAGLVGSGLGFLWFNSYPAQIFMGDVGALSLGAAIGMVAVMVRQELVLFIMGGLFVAEAVSVMAQIGSFKMTGKRLLRMAPMHHHFELKGWSEPKIIVRFWIITVILVLIGLATLKVR